MSLTLRFQKSIKGKLFVFLLILIFIFGFSFGIQAPAHGEAIAIGTTCIIIAILSACGIVTASQVDMQKLVTKVYTGLSSVVQNKINAISYMAGTTVKISADIWNEIVALIEAYNLAEGFISEPESGYSQFANVYMTELTYGNVHCNVVPVITTFYNSSDVSGSFIVGSLGSSALYVTRTRINSSSITYTYNVQLKNGDILASSLDKGFGMYIGAHYLHYPVVTNALGYGQFVPYIDGHYTLVGNLQQENSFFTTWRLNGAQLSFNNGYIQYTKSGTTYNVGTQNQYKSVLNFIYETVLNGLGYAITVANELYGKYVKSIPADNEVTLNTKKSIEEAIAASLEAVLAKTATAAITATTTMPDPLQFDTNNLPTPGSLLPPFWNLFPDFVTPFVATANAFFLFMLALWARFPYDVQLAFVAIFFVGSCGAIFSKFLR